MRHLDAWGVAAIGRRRDPRPTGLCDTRRLRLASSIWPKEQDGQRPPSPHHTSPVHSSQCALDDLTCCFSQVARKMLVSLTVGKVDAGVAVLLTQDNRLVSSPPFLLLAPHGLSRRFLPSPHLLLAISAHGSCAVFPGWKAYSPMDRDANGLLRTYRLNSPLSSSLTTSPPAALSTSTSRATMPRKLPVQRLSRASRSASSIPMASVRPRRPSSVSEMQPRRRWS